MQTDFMRQRNQNTHILIQPDTHSFSFDLILILILVKKKLLLLLLLLYFCTIEQRLAKSVPHFTPGHVNIVTIAGGSLRDSQLIHGFVFKKPFAYAGCEQEAKRLEKPRILLLNQEIELKHQKEFAQLAIQSPLQYKQFVDTEWNLVYRKLDQIYNAKCNLVLDVQGIGDLATQHFVQRGISHQARVPISIMEQLASATGTQIYASLENLPQHNLGTCDIYEERTIGDERYCILHGCKQAFTLILRGASEQILQEVCLCDVCCVFVWDVDIWCVWHWIWLLIHSRTICVLVDCYWYHQAKRSLHDAICVCYHVLQDCKFVAGGGATEMALRTHLAAWQLDSQSKEQQQQQGEHDPLLIRNKLLAKYQTCIHAYGDALEELVQILADNACLPSTYLLPQLRHMHEQEQSRHVGICLESESYMDDMVQRGIVEPLIVKLNAYRCATDAACTILNIDFVVKMPQLESEEGRAKRIAEELKRKSQLEQQWKQKQANKRKEMF